MSLLTKLPPEVLEQVAEYLFGGELARLALTCTRLYSAFNQDALWVKVREEEELFVSDQVVNYCQSLRDSLPPSSLPTPCLARLSYLVGERVRKNWARSNYKEGLVHHLSEEARVGGNLEHLVLLENTRLRAWRTDQSWIQLITSRPVPIRVDNPQQSVYQILVCRDIVILCFTFGGGASSDFQQLQGYDLASNCDHVWTMSGLLGTQYHVVRLLADRLFVLDVLKEEVSVYEIGREQPVAFQILRQGGRGLPTTHLTVGLSASDHMLVLPGRLVPENSPILSVWQLQSGHKKLLQADRPVCPFRWFEHTAVLGDIVLGLLNRFRLLGWCASEEAVIFSIDLTSSSPGEARQTFSWLAVTSPDLGLALTVHKDLFVVSVISIGGIHCGKVVPILPDWGYEEEAVAMVEQVEVHGLTAIIKVVASLPEHEEPSCLIYTSDLTPFLDYAIGRGAKERLSLLANQAAEHAQVPGQPCHLITNSTKIFEVRPIGIKFYDFLHTEERFPDHESCDC